MREARNNDCKKSFLFSFISKVHKNYIANSILITFFFLNVNKKEENSCFFFPKFDIGWVEMRDNQINFLFSGQFHIGFVRIKTSRL
ncbi:hypothetical protein PAHAL_5G168900 [Panicum hallii]|uniref:Uncharacterized protein n=1 Tax=Panicum hallii TaxID=206008 RepID=A0A2S3HS64_9POAL|nr:hypothetical protein PAHAL_5G168900 [Panicum hallii]